MPSYKFYDPDVDAAVSGMVNQFSTASVNLVSWTDDWSKLLYLIYGSDTPGSYVLQDRETGQMMLVADERDNIPPDAVGQMVSVNYKARDGLNIPSILIVIGGTFAITTASFSLNEMLRTARVALKIFIQAWILKRPASCLWS